MLGMKLGPGRIEQPITVEQMKRWVAAAENVPTCIAKQNRSLTSR